MTAVAAGCGKKELALPVTQFIPEIAHSEGETSQAKHPAKIPKTHEKGIEPALSDLFFFLLSEACRTWEIEAKIWLG